MRAILRPHPVGQLADGNSCAIRSALSGNMACAGERLRAATEPLVLDALAMGDLVHMTLDRALRNIESGRLALANATAEQIAAAVDAAIVDVARVWEIERAGTAARHLAANAG